eukprot:m.1622399 g.1622399  ORF g.1622399 m.1622399 type:complete len:203 (+) comp25384_c1_seq38:72-680(+)
MCVCVCTFRQIHPETHIAVEVSSWHTTHIKSDDAPDGDGRHSNPSATKSLLKFNHQGSRILHIHCPAGDVEAYGLVTTTDETGEHGMESILTKPFHLGSCHLGPTNAIESVCWSPCGRTVCLGTTARSIVIVRVIDKPGIWCSSTCIFLFVFPTCAMVSISAPVVSLHEHSLRNIKNNDVNLRASSRQHCGALLCMSLSGPC